MAEPPYSLEEFWSIVAALANDVKKCAAEIETLSQNEGFEDEDESGLWFWRRMCAQTVWTAIEGSTYHMTYIAYVARNSRDVVFTLDELQRLERAYDFDEDREIEAGLRREQMLERIKFAFNSFARVHYSDYVLPVNEPEWSQIKEVFRIKEALEHPQSTAELEVHSENVTDLLQGIAWFMKCMVAVLEDCRDTASERVASWEEEKDEPIM